MKKQKTIPRKISIGLTIGLIILITAVAFAVQSRNDGTQPRPASDKAPTALETDKDLSKFTVNPKRFGSILMQPVYS